MYFEYHFLYSDVNVSSPEDDTIKRLFTSQLDYRYVKKILGRR